MIAENFKVREDMEKMDVNPENIETNENGQIDESVDTKDNVPTNEKFLDDASDDTTVINVSLYFQT